MFFMQIKKSTFSKIIFASIVFPALAFLSFVFISQAQPTQRTELKFENGKQIIEFTAKNGFNPSLIEAQAGVDSIIRIKTLNTYDCSGFLNMPNAGISNHTLKPSGITEFSLAKQEKGEIIRGSCSSGANIVEIRFI